MIPEISPMRSSRTSPSALPSSGAARSKPAAGGANTTCRRALSKQIQTKPSKSPWICLVLFVRIGAFQGFTANPNKKNRFRSDSPLGLCAKRPSADAFLSRQAPASRGLDSGSENTFNTYFWFCPEDSNRRPRRHTDLISCGKASCRPRLRPPRLTIAGEPKPCEPQQQHRPG